MAGFTHAAGAGARRGMLALALTFLAMCQLSAALYSSSSPVISLTPSDFQKKIKSGGVWMVEVRKAGRKERMWHGYCGSSVIATRHMTV
jgi:hypothetical protein